MEEARLAGTATPPSAPAPVQIQTEQGMVGRRDRVCPDINMPDQEPKGSEPITQYAGQASQWGAGVPNLFPRTPKLDILG